MLTRTRVFADFQTACALAHNVVLEQAIDELDRRIAALPAG